MALYGCTCRNGIMQEHKTRKGRAYLKCPACGLLAPDPSELSKWANAPSRAGS